jgi:hypothetical protein
MKAALRNYQDRMRQVLLEPTAADRSSTGFNAAGAPVVDRIGRGRFGYRTHVQNGTGPYTLAEEKPAQVMLRRNNITSVVDGHEKAPENAMFSGA